MDKKKFFKISAGIIIAAIPFGLVTIGGYYAYKKYRESKEKNKKIE